MEMWDKATFRACGPHFLRAHQYHGRVRSTRKYFICLQTPIQETDPLPKIELIRKDSRRVAGKTACQETLLPGKDGFMGREGST